LEHQLKMKIIENSYKNLRKEKNYKAGKNEKEERLFYEIYNY